MFYIAQLSWIKYLKYNIIMNEIQQSVLANVYQKAWKKYIIAKVWLLGLIILKNKMTSNDSDSSLDSVLIDQEFAKSAGTIKA